MNDKPLDPQLAQSIKQWFEEAKPFPTKQNVVQQIAYHLEEVAEMLEALDIPSVVTVIRGTKNFLLSLDEEQSAKFLENVNQKELLDSLADQVVTAIGVGHMARFDIVGALKEVNRSNWSKFDDKGKAIINEQGKIAKGPNYQPPELTPYLTEQEK